MARTESEPGHQTTFYKEGERSAFFCFLLMPRKNTAGIGGMKYHEIFA